MKSRRSKRRFAVCLKADCYAASLVERKIYEVVPDPAARRRGLVRVIDESGEDYLYPEAVFAAIEVPPAVDRIISPPR